MTDDKKWVDDWHDFIERSYKGDKNGEVTETEPTEPATAPAASAAAATATEASEPAAPPAPMKYRELYPEASTRRACRYFERLLKRHGEYTEELGRLLRLGSCMQRLSAFETETLYACWKAAKRGSLPWFVLSSIIASEYTASYIKQANALAAYKVGSRKGPVARTKEVASQLRDLTEITW